MGLALFALTILLFAGWVTCHSLLCVLVARRSLWRGFLAFWIFPFAPFFAGRSPNARRTWIVLLVLYAISLGASFIETI